MFLCIYAVLASRIRDKLCVPRIRIRIQRAIYQSSLKLCTDRPPVCPWYILFVVVFFLFLVVGVGVGMGFFLGVVSLTMTTSFIKIFAASFVGQCY